ncbi:helix-turn-helix domain-containing protein [Campylobacter geochelonis]|uniref:helix-turn-helix domain-containing protein n=1 Tax=Campylobacter geochelonis TaxID=1780362 RepID=UPI0007708C87|nr:helix-turn-helix transcriptional regulator [Campylobacter geochelonis]CZE46948.1 Helix-turn-helix domain [Campylobacter geochelonis]CZE50924.1 Helix-turn-helix domain [Campylobacter geochelonis]
MLVHEKINQIIKLKGMNKKEFATKFLALAPQLKSTGDTPSLPTIYNYLNGNREIKADMLPFIAQALDISEQELFFKNDKDIEDFYKRLLLNDEATSMFSKSKSQQITKIISLCSYAPEPLLDKLIGILEKNHDNVMSCMKGL